MRNTIVIAGADRGQLDELWSTGRDHGGNPVEPFVDHDGDWPLRCCLSDSQPGDEVAIVAWSPFPWQGPYAELGPIVIHARPCAGVAGHGIPEAFLSRRQVVRPYVIDRRIAYDRIAIVQPDGSLPGVVADALAHDDIDFALVRNVASGCWSFTASPGPGA